MALCVNGFSMTYLQNRTQYLCKVYLMRMPCSWLNIQNSRLASITKIWKNMPTHEFEIIGFFLRKVFVFIFNFFIQAEYMMWTIIFSAYLRQIQKRLKINNLGQDHHLALRVNKFKTKIGLFTWAFNRIL